VPVAALVLIPLGFVLVGSSPAEMLFGLFALLRRRPAPSAAPGS